ncbi:actin-like protein Arp6p [[Candida] anglica]
MKNLVVDNGSYTVKCGFSGDQKSPQITANTVVRTRDGAIHTGNAYLSQHSQYSGMLFKRPHEQGNLTSWEIERPVWDIAFEELRVDAKDTRLILSETPFQLPQLSINTDQIVFEEYGFDSYYRAVPQALVDWVEDDEAEGENGVNSSEQKLTRKSTKKDVKPIKSNFSLIIDSGFNCTWIVPMLYNNVYWKGVRKFPLGGRAINGLLRELISFRHYDVSDEAVLINTIKESTCFMAQDYKKTLSNRSSHDCVFVLPDFKTTTTGYIRDDSTKRSKNSDDSEQQVLHLSDERFTPSEAFYHPEIIFNSSTSNSSKIHSSTFKNLTDLIVESIMTCPVATRPMLSANISIVGGTSKMKNFKERLSHELTSELPMDWTVRIRENRYDAIDMAWHGGVSLSEDDRLNDVCISKKEYFEHGPNWCQRQFGFKNQ